ncbi:MAG: acyltransferase family protein [bacterium]
MSIVDFEVLKHLNTHNLPKQAENESTRKLEGKNGEIAPARSPRNVQIDFLKGLLVLTMIIYHVSYNFYQNHYSIIAITQFASGAFIYITGFFVGYYYLNRYPNRLDITKRLFIRFLKLFLIFSLPNIFLFLKSKSFIDVLYTYFILGTGKTHFEILLPIAYTLFFSSFLVLFVEKHEYCFHVLLIIPYLLVIFNIIHLPTNSLFCLIGLFGFANSLLISRLRNSLPLKAVCFIAAVVLGWSFLEFEIQKNSILYLLYIITVLVSLYNIGCFLSFKTKLEKWIVLIGRYTLFAYLYHLVIIVSAYSLFPIKVNACLTFAIIVFVTFILVVSLFLLERLRRKVTIINKSYGFIFS